MRELKKLFDQNRAWSERVRRDDPDFFPSLARIQKPNYLWIGCADSRVGANQITDLAPGQIFVHRNIANVVVHTDLNMLSVMQYAVDVLNIDHIIVCGHYGCGGVRAAVDGQSHGLIDNWLRHIKDVWKLHEAELRAIDDKEARHRRLCELNVEAQVANVCHTTIVQGAWSRGERLVVHGWIYSLEDGLLRDLDLCVEKPEQLPAVYRMDT